MRTRYTIREPGVPYFITCTVVKWLPLFTRKPYFDLLLDTLQFCRRHKGLKIYAIAAAKIFFVMGHAPRI